MPNTILLAFSICMKALVSELTAMHSDIAVAGPQAARSKNRTNKVREGSNCRETVADIRYCARILKLVARRCSSTDTTRSTDYGRGARAAV